MWCSKMSAPSMVVELTSNKTAFENRETIPSVADLPYSPHGASNALWLSCSSGSIKESMFGEKDYDQRYMRRIWGLPATWIDIETSH